MSFSLRFRRTLFAVSLANAVLLAAVFVGQFFTSETLWPLALLSFIPQQILLVPALVLFAVANFKK